MERVLRRLLPDGAFNAVPSVRSRMMSAIRGRGNRTTERRLRGLLAQAGIRGWRVHPRGIVGSPDFLFDLPHCRVAIFTDGCFWHGCRRCARGPMATNPQFWKAKIARTRARDRRVMGALRREGYLVLRIWEHDLRERPAAVVAAVREALAREQPEGRAGYRKAGMVSGGAPSPASSV
jgi:DNA mismatch endonuclease (patch repair protein)